MCPFFFSFSFCIKDPIYDLPFYPCCREVLSHRSTADNRFTTHVHNSREAGVLSYKKWPKGMKCKAHENADQWERPGNQSCNCDDCCQRKRADCWWKCPSFGVGFTPKTVSWACESALNGGWGRWSRWSRWVRIPLTALSGISIPQICTWSFTFH